MSKRVRGRRSSFSMGLEIKIVVLSETFCAAELMEQREVEVGGCLSI